MNSGLYDGGRNRFARAEIRWRREAGDTIRAFLVDTSLYSPDLAKDEYLSAIPAKARYGNEGKSGRADAPRLALLDPKSGICDAEDVVFQIIPRGRKADAIVLFKDDGTSDQKSPLVALVAAAKGLPLTTNGADITIEWDDGANRIFKL